MMRRRCFGESRREHASATRDEPKLRPSSFVFVVPLSYYKRIMTLARKKKEEKNKENNRTRSKCLN